MTGFLTLDSKGAGLAFVMGVLIFVLGRNFGGLFLADILIFLMLSALVTNVGKRKKEGIGVYERARGWRNVLSNGLVPLLVSFAYFVSVQGSELSAMLVWAYIASVAAVTADKFSSEVGVLDGEPIMLLTLRKVKKGMSGGVTLLGFCASIAGALIISASVFLVGTGAVMLFIIVAVSGFFGGIVDSLFGYFEEKGLGNKYTSNFLCAVAGAALCFLLCFMLLPGLFV